MPQRPRHRAACAAFLALSVALARSDAGAGTESWDPLLEAAWVGAPRPLPFDPHLPARLRHGPLPPARLGWTLSLAESLVRASPRIPGDAELEPEAGPGHPVPTWSQATPVDPRPQGGSQSRLPPEIELHGFLKVTGSAVRQWREPVADDSTRDMSLNAARLSVAADMGFLSVYLSADGSTDHGTQYLIRSGELDGLEFLDAYAGVRLAEGLELRVGQFKPPVLFSGMIDENELLFLDHTGISRTYQERYLGMVLHGQHDRLQGWLALQEGSDETSEDWAWTARGTVRVVGEGLAPRREGAYDTDLGATLYLGASWQQDNSVADYQSFATEAYYTYEWFSLAGEVIAPGDGVLGGRSFWNLTTSAMLVPDRWEVAFRVENFQTRAGALVGRLGVNRYLDGPNSKLQCAVSRLQHDDSHLDLTALDLTLLVSF